VSDVPDPEIVDRVALAIRINDGSHSKSASDLATVAMTALLAELERQGFAIVKVGSVPPWMELAVRDWAGHVMAGEFYYRKGPL
jgi:hypothetical protein